MISLQDEYRNREKKSCNHQEAKCPTHASVFSSRSSSSRPSAHYFSLHPRTLVVLASVRPLSFFASSRPHALDVLLRPRFFSSGRPCPRTLTRMSSRKYLSYLLFILLFSSASPFILFLLHILHLLLLLFVLLFSVLFLLHLPFLVLA